MDDLAGLDWNVPSQQANRPAPLNSTANYYPSLKPTPPLSGRSTPTVNNLSKAPATLANASTPQHDSFANLLPTINSSQTTKSLSLKEQQALLEEQKRQKTLYQARQWDTLGTGSTSTSASVSRNASPAPFSVQALNSQLSGQRSPLRSITPLQQISSKSYPARQHSQDVNDILAAFDSSAPVDRSTNFPVPSRPESSNVTAASAAQSVSNIKTELFNDNDDPFGLRTASKGSARPATITDDNDDDVLGLLGKPVSELPQPRSTSPIAKPSSHPVDAAVAELVEMGFSARKARDALATTESGLDIQAAVGHLLNQAHSESRNKNKSSPDTINGNGRRHIDKDPTEIAWARQKNSGSVRRQEDVNQTSTKDPAKYASEMGNNFIKSASSLWKAGQKKVNQAIAEYNTEADSSQPKWMRGASPAPESRSVDQTPQDDQHRRPSQTSQVSPQNNSMTDEAALLEIGGGRPQPPRLKRSDQPPLRNPDQDLRDLRERQSSQQRTGRSSAIVGTQVFDQTPPVNSAARTRLTRGMNEETSAYISPSRRKGPARKSSDSRPKPALFTDDESIAAPLTNAKSSQIAASGNVQIPKTTSARSVTTNSEPPKLRAIPRNIPPIGASTLQSSTSNRMAGTAAFKLGNYSDAHAFYTSALRDIPKQHPLTIVLLTNRALTSLKTGDPKQCIEDVDQAIKVIGSSRGANESITLGGDEGTKDMAPYWGKAMMRRAEAMEQLERWADAAQVWKDCVEAGVGGAQSIQGRARCEKASGTGQASQPASRKPTPAPKKLPSKPSTRSALDELAGRPVTISTPSSEAVTRLRAANDAAAKLDDERFALTDAVADRVERWRKGKEQNLRALLGSLDTVLWVDSGWKKIGMSELLNPNKVKINYMKGIAKVHPDKLPPTATTEQIMISGSVFSTLNEAWDGFKKENSL